MQEFTSRGMNCESNTKQVILTLNKASIAGKAILNEGKHKVKGTSMSWFLCQLIKKPYFRPVFEGIAKTVETES